MIFWSLSYFVYSYEITAVLNRPVQIKIDPAAMFSQYTGCNVRNLLF